ncbi:transglycosylase SLT domain-containing protein (plasmid) [Aneurinibacillus sp. Ricciae_BoGa-3]|uniref:transglycosylase SLT domain-containing protein n=1 Tax=Aneurinibacillus sp. Ricciae_BoGa-3 TaxID=3022697 RepID=UPI00233FD345|nr:transglycosylase SLT domain-containing protein [Aneurinibacillus sp. Ricciae_BoGa-3]WCK57096.1 transglycosylase SLT domain-containing protein [Aneurinibacillus sp. Ricciae_BoGa-3]
MKYSHLYQSEPAVLKREQGSEEIVKVKRKLNQRLIRKFLVSIASLTLITSVVLPTVTTVSYAQTAKATNTNPYNSKIPMKKEYQEYLYKLCQQRGLDYRKALAIIQTESTFNPNSVCAGNYGLFQINRLNFTNYAQALGTPVKPLDPYININWGTYELSNLYTYWSKRGIQGDQLDDYVWSSYNRGLYGFKKYGKMYSYIQHVRTHLAEINRLF